VKRSIQTRPRHLRASAFVASSGSRSTSSISALDARQCVSRCEAGAVGCLKRLLLVLLRRPHIHVIPFANGVLRTFVDRSRLRDEFLERDAVHVADGGERGGRKLAARLEYGAPSLQIGWLTPAAYANQFSRPDAKQCDGSEPWPVRREMCASSASKCADIQSTHSRQWSAQHRSPIYRCRRPTASYTALASPRSLPRQHQVFAYRSFRDHLDSVALQTLASINNNS
jgi:hypothetical protein